MKSFFPIRDMMRLQELLSRLTVQSLQEPVKEMNPEIRSLDYDSRRVKEGSLFFAVEGERTDGHLYIDEALRRGAVAVASQREPPPGATVPWVQVEAVRPFMASLADRFYQQPSRRLQLVGPQCCQ